MKNIAIGIMMVILLSIIIEPLVDISNIMREKVILGTAVTNACRAARDRSLNAEKLRDMDAEVESDLFKTYFSEVFEEIMDVSEVLSTGDTLEFVSNDGKYNKITVVLNITNEVDVYSGNIITKANVKAESKYKFKTKHLQFAEQASGAEYILTNERMLIISVKN